MCGVNAKKDGKAGNGLRRIRRDLVCNMTLPLGAAEWARK